MCCVVMMGVFSDAVALRLVRRTPPFETECVTFDVGGVFKIKRKDVGECAPVRARFLGTLHLRDPHERM